MVKLHLCHSKHLLYLPPYPLQLLRGDAETLKLKSGLILPILILLLLLILPFLLVLLLILLLLLILPFLLLLLHNLPLHPLLIHPLLLILLLSLPQCRVGSSPKVEGYMMTLVCAIVVLTIIINYQQKEKGIMNKIHQWVKLTIVSSIYISERNKPDSVYFQRKHSG
jgi:hypothetical protein